MNDKSDGHKIVLEMIKERTATRFIIKRPAEGMLHMAGLVHFGPHLPQFLDADTKFLRLAVMRQAVACDQLLGEMPARPFRKERVFPQQFHAAGIAIFLAAVFGKTHITGCDTDDLIVRAIKHLARGKTGIDLNPQRLRFLRQPPADISERNNIIPVIAKQFRHENMGQAQGALRVHVIKFIRHNGGLEGMIGIGLPIR